MDKKKVYLAILIAVAVTVVVLLLFIGIMIGVSAQRLSTTERKLAAS